VEQAIRLDSVGINRREVVNERVIQEKGIANHPGPDHVRAVGNPALEALDRGTCRLDIPEVDELRKRQIEEPTVSAKPEGNRAADDTGECAAPCGDEDPMHA